MAEPAYADLTGLVVDDQEFVRNIVSKMLEQIGFGRIETAADGAAAMDFIKAAGPCVVVCDIEMSPVDGLDFLRQIRETDDPALRSIPVIFLTSHGQHELVTKARALGGNGFVLKPATVKGLKERIDHSLQEWPGGGSPGKVW